MSICHKPVAVLAAAAVMAVLVPVFLAGQTAEPKAELPALITSCGQSNAPTTIKIVMQRLKMAYDIDPLATPEMLQAKAKAGTPYRTLGTANASRSSARIEDLKRLQGGGDRDDQSIDAGAPHSDLLVVKEGKRRRRPSSSPRRSPHLREDPGPEPWEAV